MVSFNFTFDPGTTVQQMVGFEMAGRIWSSYLTDNATINIHVGVSSNLGSNVIGGAIPAMRASQSYSDFRARLQSDISSMDDAIAVANLTQGSSFLARFELFLDGGSSSFNELPRRKRTGYQNQKSANCSSLCNLRYSLP